MKREILLNQAYLYFPVRAGRPEKRMCVYVDGNESWTWSFMVPVMDEADDAIDFWAEIPVGDCLGKKAVIELDAPDGFFDKVHCSEKHSCLVTEKRGGYALHFSAETGWSNDPNGMVYKDGIYHLYFQYNPFNTSWENMSWGHAVSKDLLHWEQLDSVLFPEKGGTMFSGCGILNERKMLGLPENAMLFYYTIAGGVEDENAPRYYSQKIAYSLDGGRTLQKIDEPTIPMIYTENRDPKVFWHEPSKAYVMALWLAGNDYAIFRSDNMWNWTMSDRITLEDAWECPDLFPLKDESGKEYWVFWSADGYYAMGNFDGYHFEKTQPLKKAYVSALPYAAQSFSNVGEKVISIPWLRLENRGRVYTGAYGIPTEFTCRTEGDEKVLYTWPVKALFEQARKTAGYEPKKAEHICVKAEENGTALMIQVQGDGEKQTEYLWRINQTDVHYVPNSGRLTVGKEKYKVGCNCSEFLILIDGEILEIFIDGGKKAGTFALDDDVVCFEMRCEGREKLTVYEVC